MTREIEFRAWEKNLKEKIPVYDINFKTQMINTLTGARRTFQEVELMQFTGLKDKNGKEIYEGDIIQYKYYHANKRWWRTVAEINEIEQEVRQQRENIHLVKSEVKFRNGQFEADYPVNAKDIWMGQRIEKGSNTHSDYETKYWDFEVIGNIYENPELLQ